MWERIYLTVSRDQVVKMTKNPPDLKRGEVPVRLDVTVDDTVFGAPVIEQAIHVTDWREGLVFPDVDLKEAVITQEEAAIIRARRLEAMRAALEEHGYEVKPPDDDSGAEFD